MQGSWGAVAVLWRRVPGVPYVQRDVLPWVVALTVGALAVAFHVLVTVPLLPVSAPHRVDAAWLALAALAAELVALRVPVRRELHALGLDGAVLTVGLLTAPVPTVVGALAVGTFLGLALGRDTCPVRLLSATARTALSATVGSALFLLLARGAVLDPVPEPRALLAAVAGALLAGTVGALAAVGAAAADGEEQSAGFLARLGAGAVAGSLAAGGLGAGTVALLAPGDLRTVLLLVPAGVLLLLTAVAAVRGRRTQADLAALRSATRAVLAEPDEDRLPALLASAVRALGAGRGELLLAAEGSADAPGRAYLHVEGLPLDDGPALLDPVAAAALPALTARPLLLPRIPQGDPAAVADLDEDLARWLLVRGWPDVVSAPVRADGEPVGVLAVSGRRRGTPRLDVADLELLGALADQVGLLVSAARLARRVDSAEATRSDLERRAFTDDLTGLARRPLFADRVAHAASQRGASGSLAVLYLDLDGFKEVNDRLGHGAGDAVLVAVAQRVTPLLRAGDTAARLGGDEFAVLLTGLDGADRAALVAARLLSALSAPIPVPGGSARVRASIGIAVARPGDDVESLLADADAAMYEAKRAGGDCWVAADRGTTPLPLDPSSGRSAQLVAALREPRLPGALEVHYQPYVDLGTGQVVGVEALVRWRHPELGLLHPADFVPLAERLGRMAELGREVLDSALHQLARWDAAGAPPLQLSVNLSASQLRDAALVQTVERALVTSGVSPDRLVLEVSEAAVGDHVDEVLPVMVALAERGVRWALDGFGSGRLPLGRLDALPLDRIKIDAGLLGDERSPSHLGLTEGLVRLGRSLGLRVVAEGVEHETQATLLRGLRCDQAQGFHYGHPEPAGAGVGGAPWSRSGGSPSTGAAPDSAPAG